MNMMALLGVLKPEDCLGAQVISTIPDAHASFETLQREWTNESLDSDLLPAPSTLVNTAENACASVKTRKGRVSGHDDRKLVIDVDRIATNGKSCEYQVTRKVLDTANRVIEHKKGMTMTFDATAHEQSQDPWTVRPFAEADYLAVRDLELAVREHFNAHVGKVPGQRVRNALREYLTRKANLSAIPMKEGNGGVYFVQMRHTPTLDALQRIVRACYGDKAQFDLYVIPNSPGAREQVAERHNATVADDADALIARISDRLGETGKPRTDFIERAVADFNALCDHKREIDELLGSEARKADTALDLIQMQLDRLLTKV